MEDPIGEKRLLRREMRRRLGNIRPAEVASNEGALLRALEGWPRLGVMEHLLAYAPFGTELSPVALLNWWLAGGRALHLPRVADDGITLELYRVDGLTDLICSPMGIMEPSPLRCAESDPGQLDIVLVPGLAFDTRGVRLGRGGGHYDRLLARLPEATLRVGIGWDLQVMTEHDTPLPAEEHDARMDYLCTPSGLIRCEPGRRAR